MSFASCPTTLPTAPGCRGDDHGLAGTRRADFVEPEPGRDAGHPENAEEIRRRNPSRVDRLERSALRHAPLLPAEGCQHGVAQGETRVLRRDDLADGLADHHLADLDRRHIRFRVAHATAHVGIERQPAVANQNLARAGRRDRRVDETEVLLGHRAPRAAREDHLAIHRRHRAPFPSACGSSAAKRRR
jgi:hypothetical protein